jgi:hypothetical protein
MVVQLSIIALPAGWCQCSPGPRASSCAVCLSHCCRLVIDEADTMFDQGFGEDMTKLLGIFRNKQTPVQVCTAAGPAGPGLVLCWVQTGSSRQAGRQMCRRFVRRASGAASAAYGRHALHLQPGLQRSQKHLLCPRLMYKYAMLRTYRA